MTVDIDKASAAHYFKKAADQGDSEGLRLYDESLKMGLGVDLDRGH